MRVLMALLLWVNVALGQDTFRGVSRIVAIGDIHGDYDRLEGLLRSARLTDNQNAWVGGTAHLVLTGDFLDRGPQSRRVMDFLMGLEPQARSTGGMVHVLIGNHEAMNVTGDLRYVSNADFESYRASNSRELRDQAFANLVQDLTAKHTPPPNLQQFKSNFEKERPLGLVEQRIYFAPDGKYGKWIRSLNAVIQINDVIFLHGGISSKYESLPLAEINRAVREELDDAAKRRAGLSEDPQGPLWYRELVTSSTRDKALTTHLDRLFKQNAARHIVIGHTIVPAILPRFGGRVIAIDVGLSQVYRGPSAFLLIEGSNYYAVHQGERVDLPVGTEGVPAYLRTVRQIDPSNATLRRLAERGDR